MSFRLAIVIPAFKKKYLAQALASIAAQTNKDFKVYIGDDGSPEDLLSIIKDYEDQFELEYHRYDSNLGNIDLVKHWNRSVEMATEEWILLFSDDDIMQPNCVQSFYDALNETQQQYNLYRFNIEMIDADGQVICVKEPHPEIESSYTFLVHRLQSKSLSAAVEYIFKKEVFENYGGFVNFPMAYCSDDASWIRFADDKPIYTIAAAKVYWRSSGINISSSAAFTYKKADAVVQFIRFILNKFHEHAGSLLPLSESWFYENLNYINGRLNLWQCIKLWLNVNILFKTNKALTLKKIISSQLRNTRFAGKL